MPLYVCIINLDQMKMWFYFSFIMVFIGCQNNTNQLLGTWRTVNPFFSGTYQIKEMDGKIVAQILSLNDGTSAYTYTGQDTLLEFINIQPHEDHFIDAVTGATSSIGKSTTLHLISPDSLEITTKQFKKDLQHIWVRTSINKTIHENIQHRIRSTALNYWANELQ